MYHRKISIFKFYNPNSHVHHHPKPHRHHHRRSIFIFYGSRCSCGLPAGRRCSNIFQLRNFSKPKLWPPTRVCTTVSWQQVYCGLFLFTMLPGKIMFRCSFSSVWQSQGFMGPIVFLNAYSLSRLCRQLLPSDYCCFSCGKHYSDPHSS